MGMLTKLTSSGTGISILGDAVGGVGQLGGQYMGMMNEKDQYKYQAAALRNEAILARRQARDIRIAGGKEMQKASQEYAQMSGMQRAQLAANGVVVDQDTAAQMQADTARIAAMDKSTILANAEKEAMASMYRSQIKEHQAKMAKAASKQATWTGLVNMGSTVMTSGGSIASKWLQLKDSDETVSSADANARDLSEKAHQYVIGY